ncbi:hypothetical protein B296_00031828 [Ensete ventricosum]|uniref:Mei2-like C-terminal RNA recognition motif domain-containing protein n=1 Tax=Ensete ventricosum TaxID=4639 RepID=A0A427AFC8_ENSVE|nr:hypothetical protein B296_00031828 [Ensete ventricosum]
MGIGVISRPVEGIDKRHLQKVGSASFNGHAIDHNEASQLHWLELTSHNIFSCVGGNCMDPSVSLAHVGILSPQLRGQIYHGRNPIFPMPGSFDGPTERIRSRRNDTNANQSDNKKQYELDIERITRGNCSNLLLMGIPASIIDLLIGYVWFSTFQNKCNVGYAFINMVNTQHIIPFYQVWYL